MVWEMDYQVASFVSWLNESAGGILTPIFKAITYMGNVGIIFIVASFVMLFFRKTRRGAIIALMALCLGVLFTNVLLKNIVNRPRPFVDTNSIFYQYWLAAGSLSESGASSPSGHTTAAMAFASALFFATRKKISFLLFIIPLLMGFTRIYFQVHYFSDILGGLIVGFACGGLAMFIFKRVECLSFIQKFCLVNQPEVQKQNLVAHLGKDFTK